MRWTAAVTGVCMLCVALALPARAAESTEDVADAPGGPYLIHPGDQLDISVWKEGDDLKRNVLVRPDGGISFPLAGDLMAAGKSVEEIRVELTGLLEKYIPDLIVTVALREVRGNRIFVIGKVARSGVTILNQDIDVMQALAIAGGTTTYAELNRILVLRRVDGEMIALPFRYGEVERGINLEQNIVLKSGDVVVVP